MSVYGQILSAQQRLNRARCSHENFTGVVQNWFKVQHYAPGTIQSRNCARCRCVIEIKMKSKFKDHHKMVISKGWDIDHL